MSLVITAADRESFGRCRRQWDFGAGIRRDLEPVRPSPVPDLDRAIRDALAVYYYPGMWDWDRGITLPLTVAGLERALARQRERCGGSGGSGGSGDGADAQRWAERLDAARAVLARYAEWAPAVDEFAPVLVEADYDVPVLDPARPSAGLVTADGAAINYRGRIDLMVVDRYDAYWIVRHRMIDGDWPPTEQLVDDTEALTACWAWEQFYLGMAITGTIYNELRCPSGAAGTAQAAVSGWPAEAARARPRPAGRARRWLRRRGAARPQPAVRQHEPSGGGRSIPQHRRMYAVARQPGQPEPIEQESGDGFRRTWLRRSPADVARAGRRLGADVAEMIRPGLSVQPSPSDDNCPQCRYLEPCRVMLAGRDAGPMLAARYRKRPTAIPEEGRLGGGSWGMGRGAAPPKFRGRGADPRGYSA